MKIVSPYLEPDVPWRRGNLHTHTTQSDGPLSPQETVDAYAVRGYDFLAISDHDRVTPFDGLNPRGMALISANEITAAGPHLLHIGAREVVAPDPDRQAVLHAVHASAGFAIVNHPNWEADFNHCPQELLETWEGYAGIEIYNGVVEWIEGSPLATDRWDRLLSGGHHVWGYANDDCHRVHGIGVAWNMVQAAVCTPEAIVEALAAGRCYASTGVTIDWVRAYGASVGVRATNADRIVAYADDGRQYASVAGPELALEIPDNTGLRYLRFECFGRGGAMAWTQPLRLLCGGQDGG